MSQVETQRAGVIAARARIAQAGERYAMRKTVESLAASVPAIPNTFQHLSRYLMDGDYQRAWSIAIMGFDPRAAAPAPTVQEIQKAVCEFYGVSRVDLLSARRTANIVFPRQVAAYLCHTMTRRSLPELGRHFGGRDHTTMLHAYRKIEALALRDMPLRSAIDQITEKLVRIVE